MADLKTFGESLREFRKRSGLTQVKLADEIPVSSQLISLWERAYQHEGRIWKPDRQAVLRLVEILADQITADEAQAWVSLLDYKLSEAELQALFPTRSSPSTDVTPLSSWQASQANLKQLVLLLPEQRLFGVDAVKQQIRDFLTAPEAPWLIALDGIGGIGKTTLANALVLDLMPAERYYDVAWVSAKQEEFVPGAGIQPIDQPALDADTLTKKLLEQLHGETRSTLSADQKTLILIDLLKRHPYLVVIDNLETVADHESLLPLLRKLARPSKILLTTRHSLYAHSDVFCFSLTELTETDVLDFLRYEARIRGMAALATASQIQLRQIYKVVGGNPLALKLVIGQLKVFPLSQVLKNSLEARGKKTDELYTYIYWQAWRTLDAVSRDVLLNMPLAQGGDLAQITALSEFDIEAIGQALEHLVALSLIEINGDLENHRYRIHRLTETFLLNEVAKWQLSQ